MKLRNCIIYSVLSAFTALLFSACVDDDLVNKDSVWLAPGTPVELSLGVTVPEGKEAAVSGSRASTDTETNRKVYDLYLFIFDAADNSLKTKYYFSSIDSKTETQCDPSYSSGGSAIIKRSSVGKGEIHHIHTTAGESKIVAVANCDRKGSAMILDDLSRIETFEQLQNIMVSTIDANGQSDFESSFAVMSGYYCDSDADHKAGHLDTPCEIETDSHNGNVRINGPVLNGTLWLTPMQARVKFLIRSTGHDAVTDSNGEVIIPAGKFKLTSWQVINLPGQVPLFCKGYDKDGENPLDTKPYNSDVMTRFDTGSDVVKEDGTNAESDEEIFGFTFFTADNHPGRGNAERIKTYGDRAAWDGSAGVETAPTDKKYTNAPEGATYLVLRGTYTGASNITHENSNEVEVKNVSAEVTYTIFLGHDSGADDGADNTDFNTYRNYNYTYMVNVSGVNTITVEVNKGIENRPDGEGHVITTSSREISLDAHYEQRVISISKQMIVDAINGGNFKMSVSVPMFDITNRPYVYCDENYNIIADNADNEAILPYMDWIKFYRHKDSEENRRYIYYTDAFKELKTVRDFMADLYEFALDETVTDMTASRKYTVYFDEYMYDANPGNPAISVTWKDVISNGQPRRFTMLGTTKFSNDHNSSFTTSGTTFVQRCMQTVYNVGAPGLERAWGTECVEEDLFADGDPTIPFGTFSVMPRYQHNKGATVNTSHISDYYPNSKYGRQNCWRVNYGPGNNYWHYKNLINTDGLMEAPANPANLNPDVTNLLSVCMGRNRDTNGNGLIDPEEMKWYLPSLEQMQLLYVGYGGLSSDVQLYNLQDQRANIDFANSIYPLKHYVTSSYLRKVWAEEGCSDSDLGILNPPKWNSDSKYYVRCIRDLGTDNIANENIPWDIESNPDASFQSIYTSSTDNAQVSDHVGGRIQMTNLNAQSVTRTGTLIDIPGYVHTFSENNFPAYEFEWADTVITLGAPSELGKIATEIATVKDQSGTSQCSTLGKGWRLPTIPELTILYWAWKQMPHTGDADLLFADNQKYALMLTRTEYSYKDLELQPPHGGGTRLYHTLDKSESLIQFSLLTQATINTNQKTPLMRCVRSYTTGNATTETSESSRSKSNAAHKRSMRRR